MNYFFLGWVFVFGAVWGSFLNVVIWRLPRGGSLKGRSACVKCGRQLRARELIPLASFLFQGGRCAHCREKISWRYPAIEFCLGLLFVLIWLKIGPQGAAGYFDLARAWLLAVFLLAVFVIDLEHFLILDTVVFPAGLGFLFLNLFQDWLVRAPSSASFSGLLAAVAGAFPFYLIWKFSRGRLMGLGDAKLMLPLGLALGFSGILVALFLAVGMGSLVGLGLLIFRKANLKSPLPFGCFLAVGALLAQMYGYDLIRWYLSLMGI